jgi:hypothetical protein
MGEGKMSFKTIISNTLLLCAIIGFGSWLLIVELCSIKGGKRR